MVFAMCPLFEMYGLNEGMTACIGMNMIEYNVILCTVINMIFCIYIIICIHLLYVRTYTHAS